MRTIRFTVILVILGVIVAAGAFAQADSHIVTVNIPQIALLAINGGDVTLVLQHSGIPGDPGTADTDATTKLYYTSLVPSLGFNKITSEITESTSVPASTTVTVEATSITATGAGGTAAGVVNFTNMLGATAQDFITDIESAYTGTGAGGAVLEYTLNVVDYTLLRAESPTFTVTYTITTQ